MEIELRPLSTGEVLDRTFRMYRAQFGMFVGIATVAAMIDTAGSAVQTFAIRFATRHFHDKALAGGLAILSIYVELFIAMVAAALVVAALARVVMWLHERQPVSIASGIRTALPRWYRYVALAMIHWFLSILPFLAVLLLLMPVGLLATAMPNKSAILITLVIAWILLTVLSIPLCIWVYCRYALCITASALEGLSVGKALARSAVLSKGLRWKIFLLVAVAYVLQMILLGGLTAPVIAIILHVTHSHGQLPLPVVLYQLAVGFAVVALITPSYGIGYTLIYLDARVRKEGYDIELMMQLSAEVPDAAATGAQREGSSPFAMG